MGEGTEEGKVILVYIFVQDLWKRQEQTDTSDVETSECVKRDRW